MAGRAGVFLAVGVSLLMGVGGCAPRQIRQGRTPPAQSRPARPAPSRPTRPETPPPALRYTVTYVREPLRALEVEIVRTHEDAPEDFLFTQAGMVNEVRLELEGGEGRSLSVSSEGRLIVPVDTRVLRYRYPLEAPGRRRRSSFFTGMGEGDDWHVANRSWLMRPRSVDSSLHVQLVMKGADALLPWAPDADGVYHLKGEDLVDSGFMGLGGRRCSIQLPGAQVDVALLGTTSHVDDADLCAWIRQAATEVLTVRSTFPYPRVSVNVVSVPGSAEPGDFGMLLWSTPPSIALLVGKEVKAGAFKRDWVAVHEMLHTIHPAFIPHTSWVSEGLATYYSELARARSGRQTARRAWEELLDGFQKARSAVGSRTMEDVVTSEDSYLGTYWTGAYFALLVDVELRRVTHNQRGLDAVLDRLATSGTTATFDEFALAVDAVAGQTMFRALQARHWRRPAFAELTPLLEALGVGTGPGGVKLGAARDSPVREALEARRPGTARE